VAFTVASPDDLAADEYPGANACQAAVFTADGVLVGTGNVTVEAGRAPAHVDVDVSHVDRPPSTSAELSAKVVCEPFRGEGDFPDATRGDG
jgi:hypothetical protein